MGEPATVPELAPATFTEVNINPEENYRTIEFAWIPPPSIPSTEPTDDTPGTLPNSVVAYNIFYSYSDGIMKPLETGIDSNNGSLSNYNKTLEFPLAPGDIKFYIQTVDQWENESAFNESSTITIDNLEDPTNIFSTLNVGGIDTDYELSSVDITQTINITFTEPATQDVTDVSYTLYDAADDSVLDTRTRSTQVSLSPTITLSHTLGVRLEPAGTKSFYIRSMVAGNTNAQSEDVPVIFTMDTATTPISGLNVVNTNTTATYDQTTLVQPIQIVWEITPGSLMAIGDVDFNMYKDDILYTTVDGTLGNNFAELVLEKRLRSNETQDFYIQVVAQNNSNIFSEKVKVTYTQPEEEIPLSNAITTLNVTNVQIVKNEFDTSTQYLNKQDFKFTWDAPSALNTLLGYSTNFQYRVTRVVNGNSVVITTGVANTSVNDEDQRVSEFHLSRLPPDTTTDFYIQLVVNGTDGHDYSNIFSSKVPVNVYTPKIADGFPAFELTITNVKCSLNNDPTDSKATFTWDNNQPALQNTKHTYNVFWYNGAGGTKSILFTLPSKQFGSFTLDFPNTDNIDINSDIYLEAFETDNANVYSSIVKFDISMVCLLKGTLVKTQDSYVPIEDLKVGDVVLNHKEEPTKITKTTMINLSYIENPVGREVNTIVYKIPAGQYGATKDVFLTHHHKFLANGKMVRPFEAGLKRAEPEEICDENKKYTVCHLRLEDEYKNHFIVNGDCIVEDWWDWPRPS